jgi:flagellar assembly protein FliH
MTSTHQKFTFDTVFDPAGGEFAPPPRMKRAFTADEVEQVRAQAFAEGERSAIAVAEQVVAAALVEVSRASTGALGALGRIVHEHRVACGEIALCAARTVAGAALDAYPQAPADAAFEALAREIEATPRLIVQVAPNLAERLQTILAETAANCGYPGQIVVRSDPALPRAAFVYDWGEGRASFNPEETAERVAAALRNAIAAENPDPAPHPSRNEA